METLAVKSFAKSFIIDVWHGPKYASEVHEAAEAYLELSRTSKMVPFRKNR